MMPSWMMSLRLVRALSLSPDRLIRLDKRTVALWSAFALLGLALAHFAVSPLLYVDPGPDPPRPYENWAPMCPVASRSAVQGS